MCGRFTLFDPPDRIAERFGLPDPPDLAPRYNIAPSQPVAAVRLCPEAGGRTLAMLRWGLVPSWAKDPSVGSRMINARAETVARKPSFRAAFRSRRCLVPASGFYEWERLPGRKQPWYVRAGDGSSFAIAGLWERWTGPSGDPLESVALITTEANRLLAPIHPRMPVIVSPDDYDLWLGAVPGEEERLGSLLRPWPAEEMTAGRVGTRVNSPANDSPELIAPLA